MEFFEGRDASELSSLVPSSEDQGHFERMRVEARRLGNLLAVHGFDSVDVVKIDAEGFDSRVIEGAGAYVTEAKFGVIQFEYNSPWIEAGGTLRHTVSLLEQSGYRVFLLKSEGLFDFDFELFGEYFRYSNFVAVSPRMLYSVSRLVRGGLL